VLGRLMTRWADFVYRHPWLVVCAALALAATGGSLASNVGVRSDFKYLLPDDSQAVRDLDDINKRIGGMGTLIVHVAGKDLKAMERFADSLADKLAAYPRDEVLFVDYKIDAQKAFFEHNRYLYLSVDELEEIRSEVRKFIDKKKAKANPFFVDLSSDKDKKKDDIEDIREKRGKYDKHLRKFDRFIDGYLTNREGTALLIVIKTPTSSTGVDFAEYFTKKVAREIEALNPGSFHPSLDVNLTGELNALPKEYEAVRNDVLVISNICVGLVLLAVALYFRSLRMLTILGVGLLGGVATTFGIVYLSIGYLTVATAMLAAIVAGNGINFGIYFLARYMEERQQKDPIADTLARSLRGTVLSVTTAALAAGASYASLMATQFKGFNQFGFIGGVGMVICLVFALTLDPALVVLMERHFPFKNVSEEKYRRGRYFSSAVAWIVERFPRPVFILGVAAVTASLIALALFLRDPFEYDFRKLRNQTIQEEDETKFRPDAILGERISPHILLADRVEQVPKIKAALKKYMVDNPAAKVKTIKKIKTIYDYIPGTGEEQLKKIKIIVDLRGLILDNLDKIKKEEERKEIESLVPPERLEPITVDNLPAELVRPYIELDGTRGTLMLVDMAGSIWTGESINRFASVIREVKLDNGETVRSSGKVVIFSDMLKHVTDEGPWAAAGAFSMALLVIIITFRKARHVAVMGLAMISGVALMMGMAIALGQKINFLNYIAIPIQFGIGVDYTVNIYSRFLEEGKGSIGRVLRSTGGAVMLTSLTTIIGYGSMWFSINGAINTFGTLANIGELTCLAAATLFVPSFLALFRKGLKN
jgi:predicted RND superfamily exporter protein